MARQKKLDKTYMAIAYDISLLSVSNRRAVGSVIVKNNNILSFGFNGTPSGMDNKCENKITGLTLPHVLHAESNAIAKVAQSTQSSSDAVLYTTLSPCMECAKLIIQAGIIRVVYSDVYKNTDGLTLLKECNVIIDVI
jgi:dCMP deaminase|tara:strand:+ start:37 stop:450 length:414 start_codon:yes stop_codon:yes gene_type:complete